MPYKAFGALGVHRATTHVATNGGFDNQGYHGFSAVGISIRGCQVYGLIAGTKEEISKHYVGNRAIASYGSSNRGTNNGSFTYGRIPYSLLSKPCCQTLVGFPYVLAYTLTHDKDGAVPGHLFMQCLIYCLPVGNLSHFSITSLLILLVCVESFFQYISSGSGALHGKFLGPGYFVQRPPVNTVYVSLTKNTFIE